MYINDKMCTKSSSPSTPGPSPTPQIPSTSKSPLLKAVVERICDLNYFDGVDVFDRDMIASRYKFEHLFCGECGRKCSSRAGKVSHERTHFTQKARSRRKKASINLIGSTKKPRLYTCNECFERFSERKSVTEHKVKDHNQAIYCACCKLNFKDRCDYEWRHAMNNGVTQAISNSQGYQTRSQSRQKIVPTLNTRLNGTVSSMSIKRVISSSSSFSIVSPIRDIQASFGHRNRSDSRSSSHKMFSGRRKFERAGTNSNGRFNGTVSSMSSKKLFSSSFSIVSPIDYKSRSNHKTLSGRSKSISTTREEFRKIISNPNGRLNGTVSPMSSKIGFSSSFSILSPKEIKISENYSDYGSEESDSDIEDHRSTASSRLSIISHPPAVDDGSVSPPTLHPPAIYACRMEECCFEPFDNLHALTVHESVSHNKLLLFTCPECRRRFSSKEYLRIHIFLSHSKSLTTHCPLCDMEIRGIVQTEHHANLHRNKINLSCLVCHRQFLSYAQLKEHLNNAAKYHANYKETKVVILHYNYYGLNQVDCTYDFLSIVSKHPMSNLSYTELFFINPEDDKDLMHQFCVHLPWRAR